MELLERARGMMAGIAVGNLLGIPFEGWATAEQLRETHPHGVREIEAEPGWPDDDDLAQAIILAEACSECGALDADDLMRRFWEWGELNGAGMGILTRDVLARYGGARPQRRARNLRRHGRLSRGDELDLVREPAGVGALAASRGAWEARSRNAAGNGSVMRCGPVALRWLRDDRALARNSAVSAAVTHWDPRCIWSTLLADFAIAACLRGEEIERGALLARAAGLRAADSELAQFDLPAEPPDDVLDAVETALAADAQVADLELDSGGIGYAPKTLAATLWAAHHARDVEHGLSAIVSAGGDTDTNAAPAGAALGARFGLSAIPRRWLAQVADLREDREPVEAHADRLAAKHGRGGEDRQGSA